MKTLVSVCCALLLACGVSFAGFNGPSESAGPLTQVSQALAADEMATCVLEGNIVKHLTKNRYEFTDGTGSMVVDIPPHVFGQLDVTPQDKVRLTGEIGGKKRPDRPQNAHLRVRYIEKIS